MFCYSYLNIFSWRIILMIINYNEILLVEKIYKFKTSYWIKTWNIRSIFIKLLTWMYGLCTVYVRSIYHNFLISNFHVYRWFKSNWHIVRNWWTRSWNSKFSRNSKIWHFNFKSFKVMVYSSNICLAVILVENLLTSIWHFWKYIHCILYYMRVYHV